METRKTVFISTGKTIFISPVSKCMLICLALLYSTSSIVFYFCKLASYYYILDVRTICCLYDTLAFISFSLPLLRTSIHVFLDIPMDIKQINIRTLTFC
jgi:hypothetical protein